MMAVAVGNVTRRIVERERLCRVVEPHDEAIEKLVADQAVEVCHALDVAQFVNPSTRTLPAWSVAPPISMSPTRAERPEPLPHVRRLRKRRSRGS